MYVALPTISRSAFNVDVNASYCAHHWLRVLAAFALSFSLSCASQAVCVRCLCTMLTIRSLVVQLPSPAQCRAAMRIIKAEHPEWILLGCSAHALNLLIKDLADSKRGACKWLVKVYETAIMMSNTINNSDKVRAALDYQQKKRGDGNVKAISRHTPTRFGTVHFICKDLHRERGPVKAMVVADGDDSSDEAKGDVEEGAPSWVVVSKDCEHKDSFYIAVLGGPGAEQV
jgi:hypothetical protein